MKKFFTKTKMGVILAMLSLSTLVGFLRPSHIHHWEERGRFYQRPSVESFEATQASRETIDGILYGTTFIELHCTVCGDFKTQRFTGKLGEER